MKRLLTQREKELLQQRVLKLEQARDRAHQAKLDQEVLFAQILKDMNVGDKVMLPDDRTFHVFDPFRIIDAGETLPFQYVQGQKVPKFAWEIRHAREHHSN